MLAILFAVSGCGGEKEPSPTAEPHEEVRTVPGELVSQQPPPGVLSEEERRPTPPTAQGVVLANKELGMTVSGQGAGSPERSLDILERQVLAFLPELRTVYEQERAQDPVLLGSLDINMVIEPNGGVSDLRFPVKRVSHDRLTSAVFDRMRAWMFPPTDFPVQLHFTLLFVPPGMDDASIMLWEKRLGSRPVIERVGESPTPVVAATALHKELEEEALKEKQGKTPSAIRPKSTVAEKRLATAGDPRAKKREATIPSEITGWYRVLYSTALRSAPQSSARVITQLRGGMRVRIVNVVRGQWLEVRSVSDRPPGFLWWEDAAPERTEKAERR
ncbi:MAG: SH3 domain-containing protein [Candidatus Binatia bacterium]